MNLLNLITPYSKAVVVPVVGLILGVLSLHGFSQDMSLKDVVTTLVTMVVVYLVPNRKV